MENNLENTNNPLELYVGIDLGTTNSVAATTMVQPSGTVYNPVVKIERITSIGARGNHKREKKELLPSCVAYRESEPGECDVFVGDYAKVMAQSRPYAVAKSIKSQMGQAAVSIPGFKDTYPDQKPEEVSARILKHIKQAIERQYFSEVENVIITVPACFNAAQCEATLRAAEIAGFKVRTASGKFREDILLSEPEAVIYDIINQVRNGQLNLNIDFFERPQNVLVFDIGGGTLDITLHNISRDPEHEQVFNIKPLAINRYSNIAGDTFDKCIADHLFDIYIDDYEASGISIDCSNNAETEHLMSMMKTYAEELKVAISDSYEEQKLLHRELPKDTMFACGGDMPNGYSSETDVTVEEVEEWLDGLLGRDLTIDDYRHFDEITDSNNIIYPILDVLKKAARKLNTDSVQIDAVIMNGGMSRLYLVEERLEEFFGLSPLKVSDPDKSVAQGASIFHYYKKLDQSICSSHQTFMEENNVIHGLNAAEESAGATDMPFIQTIGSILNETLYLGMRGGGVYALAESGQELPYTSEIIDGFSIASGQKKLSISIKQRDGVNSYRVIAGGSIALDKASKQETPVEIQFSLNRNGVMSFNTWISGAQASQMDIILGESESLRGDRGKMFVPRRGSDLVVANEISSIKNMLKQIRQERNGKKKAAAIGKLKEIKKIILRCGNPEEFAEPLLDLLEKDGSLTCNLNLIDLARELSQYWTPEQKKALSNYCVSGLTAEMSGFPASGIAVSANAELIKTVGACGVKEDCAKLQPLTNKVHYKNALISAFISADLEREWVLAQINSAVAGNAVNGTVLAALGRCVYRNDASCGSLVSQAVPVCEEYISSGTCSKYELPAAILTLGILYGRCESPDFASVIESLAEIYGESAAEENKAYVAIAEKLADNTVLDEIEEDYLIHTLEA